MWLPACLCIRAGCPLLLPPSPGLKALSKRPSPFYFVWRGRSPGVKYKWSAVRSSVAGLPSADSAFRGFASLEEANYAFCHVSGFTNL